MASFAHADGIALPHNTVAMVDSGKLIRTYHPVRGDLAFWGPIGAPYHVEMVTGLPDTTFGALGAGTRVGYHTYHPPYWAPSAFYRVRLREVRPRESTEHPPCRDIVCPSCGYLIGEVSERMLPTADHNVRPPSPGGLVLADTFPLRCRRPVAVDAFPGVGVILRSAGGSQIGTLAVQPVPVFMINLWDARHQQSMQEHYTVVRPAADVGICVRSLDASVRHLAL
jgi:hypothetical protein